MKKTLRAPSSWPAEARELLSEFHRKRELKIVKARSFLLTLQRFLFYQEQLGLGFRDFPPFLLDDYLALHSPYYRGHIASLLRVWLRFLFRRKQLLVPLHEQVPRFKRQGRIRRILSPEQVIQLLGLPEVDTPFGLRDRAYLEMAYGSGMRAGELTGLTLGDIDLSEGVIHIRQSKNSYARLVPMTQWTLHYLKRYLETSRPKLARPDSSNHLWLNKFGVRLKSHSMSIRLRLGYEVEKTLGIVFVPHQLRLACATHLLQAGASLRSVQELLGHRALTSTQIYTQVSPLDLKRCHDCFHPRNNGVMFDGREIAGTEPS